MRITEFNVLFLIVGLVLALIAVTPALSLVSLPGGGERFSELWLLGPELKAENFPFNVSVNEQYRVYVGVGNLLGELAYYSIHVKFGNRTHQLPNSTWSEPSTLPSLYEFRFAVSDGDVWEAPLTFTMDYTQYQQNFTYVQNITDAQNVTTIQTVTELRNVTAVQSIVINGRTFPVNNTTIWDSDRNGFYFQIFFELWLYEMTSSKFQYHQRDVRLVLNMTG